MMALLSEGKDCHSGAALTAALLYLQECVVLWQFRVLISGNEGSNAAGSAEPGK